MVISIIFLLASISLVAFNNARKKARDVKRLADMAQIQKALEFFYEDNNFYYPYTSGYGEEEVSGPDCWGWDSSNRDYDGDGRPFIEPLIDIGIVSFVPNDPSAGVVSGSCFAKDGGFEYRYYRYPAVNAALYGCPQIRPFYVLGITNMETSIGNYPGNPGWSCASRDWSGEFEWVTRMYE